MGLRLLAHFYNRNEALIVSGALDAEGVTNFIEGHAQNSVQPFSEIALGGYRIMVCEEELADALAIIDEARRQRSFEGERLSQRTYLMVSLLLFMCCGYFLPLRTSTWHNVEGRN